MLVYVVCFFTKMVNYLSIISLGFSVCFVLFYIIRTCNANAFDICALNDYLLTYLLIYLLIYLTQQQPVYILE